MSRAALVFFLGISLLVSSSLLSGQVTIAIVPTDAEPYGIVINPSTHQTYALNRCGLGGSCDYTTNGTVTVINNDTFATTQVWVGAGARDIALNTTTNTVYVVNYVCSPDPNC